MSLATNAALYRAVAKLLTSWGWPVEYAAGWETRTNGSAIRTPSAVTVHHTGGRATATSYLLNPRDRPQLKVLANIHITHDRRIKILAAGSTSHGGYTHEACYQRVVQGTAPLDRDLVPGADSLTFSINTRTVGIEVDGAGGADEWDDWTIRAVVATSAAWQIVTGWMRDGKAPRVGAHKEHTKRKPGDPYMSMGELRTRVASVVASGKPYGPTETPPAPTVPTVPGCATEPKPTPEVPTVPTPPAEPTPEVPVPVPPVSAAFRFGLANLQAQRFGGLADTSARRGKYLRDKMACSLYVLTEVPEKSRDAIRKILGAAWKVYPAGYSTVMWDSAKWIHRDRMAVDFGTGIHGAVRAELRNAATGLPLDVIGVHVRPAASFGGDQAKADKGKQADIAKMLSLYRKGVSTIIAGDFNTPDTQALARAGLVRATPAVDTLDKAGVQPLDQVWVTPDLIVRGTTLLDPGSLTDHKVWVLNLTLPASTL